MQIRPQDIIKGFKGIRSNLDKLDELKHEMVRLGAKMYNPKPSVIKEEHELGNNDFSNAYKTPMLNEIEQMDKLEKEYKKILVEITDLYAIRDKCECVVKHLINNVYINKLYTMREYSTMLEAHQTTLNKKLNAELLRIINKT